MDLGCFQLTSYSQDPSSPSVLGCLPCKSPTRRPTCPRPHETGADMLSPVSKLPWRSLGDAAQIERGSEKECN